MPYLDLRSFLDDLHHHNDLLTVTAPVSAHLETTALAQHSLKEQGPALLMTQVTPSSHPCLANLFGHERRIQRALRYRAFQSFREIGQLLAQLKEPQMPRSLGALLKSWPEYGQLVHARTQVLDQYIEPHQVLEGDAIDLSQLPIQQCWPEDAGRLITLGMVVTRGCQQDRQNIAIYRQQVLGPRRVIMRWLAHRGGAQDYRSWVQQYPEKPFPVLVVIGADPCTLLAAVTPIPDSLSEYDFAGLLRGHPSQVVRSSLTGLYAPAGAEIVLEGFIHPNDTALEGPFGDHTGYYNATDHFPVVTFERMSLRPAAIYHASYMGRSPFDEPSVMAHALNDVFVPILQKVFPEVQDFYLPPEACSYRIAVVSIRKQYPGHARRMMMGVWSWLRQFTYTKWVIVVDEDIDARNWSEVIWAITTRMDPVRDTLLVDRSPIDYLDFASPEPGWGGKIGMDATNKWPGEVHRPWGRCIVPDAQVQRKTEALWEQLKNSASFGRNSK